jgi:hypothetical protein
MAYFGFPPYSLIGLANSGYFQVRDSKPIRNVRGEVFTHAQQLDILATAQTGFFVSIVITQIANAMVCKTRRVSFFYQSR